MLVGNVEIAYNLWRESRCIDDKIKGLRDGNILNLNGALSDYEINEISNIIIDKLEEYKKDRITKIESI